MPAFSPSAPSMVQDLPDPVCPYAKMHTWRQPKDALMTYVVPIQHALRQHRDLLKDLSLSMLGLEDLVKLELQDLLPLLPSRGFRLALDDKLVLTSLSSQALITKCDVRQPIRSVLLMCCCVSKRISSTLTKSRTNTSKDADIALQLLDLVMQFTSQRFCSTQLVLDLCDALLALLSSSQHSLLRLDFSISSLLQSRLQFCLHSRDSNSCTLNLDLQCSPLRL